MEGGPSAIVFLDHVVAYEIMPNKL